MSSGRKRRPQGPTRYVAPQQRRTNPVNYSAFKGGAPENVPRVILLHKPWGVLSQFSESSGHPALDRFGLPAKVYPAGRLDRDSEGLLILTNDGSLQAAISSPRHKWPKSYWAQLEGSVDEEALQALRQGVLLKDGPTLPTEAHAMPAPDLPERDPPVRFRAHIPTSWVELILREGRNRQVRRMTAHVGYPTLRLVRMRVGPLSLQGLERGQWRELPPAEVAALKRWRPPPV